MRRRKWWQIPNLPEDDKDLFLTLARNPEYKWRGVRNLCSELGWSHQKFEDIVFHHIKNTGMIVVRKTKKGEKQIAYWENVEDSLDGKEEDTVKKVMKKLGSLAAKRVP